MSNCCNMAAEPATADIMTIQKNSQILVNVDEAIADLLVVSYCAEDKKYQGVLLDSNKGNLPFGVYSIHPAFTKSDISAVKNDDKLHSASQRFTYQEPQYASEGVSKAKKPGQRGRPPGKQKMTVRLRPRKVLCSNCQGVCNENNENVDVSKKRKLDTEDEAEIESSHVGKRFLSGSMLIPKLSRLQPSEITSAIKGTTKNSNKASENLKTSDIAQKPELTFVSVSGGDISDKDSKEKSDSFNPIFSSARTLKICFGEGEGTVVKIPAITGDFNEDSGVSCDMAKPVKPDSKAAKKALKRAKKQAKKNSGLDKSKGEVWIGSPKHIGALSPRNNMSNSPPSDPLEKKHKHKVKHKKKSKITKKRDENTTKGADGDSCDNFSDSNDHCTNQKLSISLRRLSSASFEKRNDHDNNDSGSEDCESEIVPDFPENGTEGGGGRLTQASQGDVVWGKVAGFPWWPGQVISVTAAAKAHVAWYASTTSSLMPCNSLSPFLEDYKIRFNKKKRGPYKEAVKLATIEAKKVESMKDPLASPTHGNLSAVSSPRPIDVFS